jgi:hypothetical protein
MEVLQNIGTGLLISAMMLGIFFGIPKLMDYHKYNWDEDAEENRVVRELRILQAKERLREYKEQKVILENKLKEQK